MSELTKRIIFSLLLAPVAIGGVWLGGAALAVLIAITAGIAAYEFYRLAIVAGSVPLWGHGVVLSALVPLFVHSRFSGYWVPSVTVLMVLVLELLTVALLVRGSSGKPLEVVGITILGVFYTGGMLTFSYAIRYHPYAVGAGAGTALVLLPLLLTWGTDIGAYVFGRAFGRRKLMPGVSPGKTVAGAIGGLGTAIVICILYERFALRPAASLGFAWWGAIVFGGVISIAAQVGDLVESMLKRQAGVKDSSHLIPGHGGVLDRMDSLLFTLPIGYMLLDWLLIPTTR